MKPDRHNRGLILVIVLVLVAVMSIIVVALGALAQQSTGAATLEASRLRTSLALRSGIELAKAMIANRPAEERIWLDGTATSIEFGNGIQASVAIRDAAGLIDLNRARPEFISTLAARVGLSVAETDRIKQMASTLAPIEKSNTKPEEGNRPSPIFSIMQLVPVFEEVADPQRQFLAATGLYSAAGQINPYAAPQIVLASIPEITAKDIELIEKTKKTKPGTQDPAMAEMLERLAPFLTTAEPRTFIVEIKIDEGSSLIPGSQTQAIVSLGEDPKRPFQTIALSW